VGANAAAGDEVEAGSPIVVLESMKMEMTVAAPFAGRVRDVLVGNNVQVDAGAPLVTLEPTATDGTGAPSAGRVEFAFPPQVAAGDGAGARLLTRAHVALLRTLVRG